MTINVMKEGERLYENDGHRRSRQRIRNVNCEEVRSKWISSSTSNDEKLNQLVVELEHLGVEATAFPADILNNGQLGLAFAAIKEKYGFIDVLEYSPVPSIGTSAATLEVTEENALYQFQFHVLGAITSIRQVLPNMLEKQSGVLLFTTGGAAIYPVPMMVSVGIAMSGLRNYILNLNSELKDKGIYAGYLSIGIWMQSNHHLRYNSGIDHQKGSRF